jgi:hypothetical protein
MLSFRSSSVREVLLYTLSYTVTNVLIDCTGSDPADEIATSSAYYYVTKTLCTSSIESNYKS